VLTQLPGVGPFTAPVILAEIGDVSRFGSVRKLASWGGFTPAVRGSDRVAHYGHIGRGPVSRRVAFIPGIRFPPGDSQSEFVTPRLDLVVR
jgi:transposase